MFLSKDLLKPLYIDECTKMAALALHIPKLRRGTLHVLIEELTDYYFAPKARQGLCVELQKVLGYKISEP